MTTSNNSVDFNLSTEDVLELFKGVSITDQLVFTLNGLSSDPERTAFLSRPVFETHPNLLASIIRKQPALFQFITEYAKDEWQFIDAYIEGSLLKDTSSDNIKVKFSPTFKASLVSASSWIRYRDLAQKVLSVDGYALHSMPPTIQQDRELVMTAMTSSPGSLSALPVRFGTLPSFRNDKEMIMFALSQDKGDAEFVWKAITLSAQGDRDIIRKTLSLFKTKDVQNFISRNLTQTYSNRPNVRVTIFELHPVHFSLLPKTDVREGEKNQEGFIKLLDAEPQSFFKSSLGRYLSSQRGTECKDYLNLAIEYSSAETLTEVISNPFVSKFSWNKNVLEMLHEAILHKQIDALEQKVVVTSNNKKPRKIGF